MLNMPIFPPGGRSRFRLLLAVVTGLTCVAPSAQAQAAATPELPAPRLRLPLDGEAGLAAPGVPVEVSGPHRFLRIAGRIGYQPTSLRSTLTIATALHAANEGTIVLWAAPLETLGVASQMRGFTEAEADAQEYALLSDTIAVGAPSQPAFYWRWRSAWHPAMIAKLSGGPRRSDFELSPWVITEHLPLRQERWYQLALTWNRSEHRLRLYVDGILCGATDYPFRADTPRSRLFLGNPAMAFAELAIYDHELAGPQVAALYDAAGFPRDAAVLDELRRLFTVVPHPAVDWAPDSTWSAAYQASFTRPEELEGWRQQGSRKAPYQLRELSVNPDGLLMETAEQIDNESRVYLWSPDSFEGDVAVQFDFRPEKDSGLALLVVDASGMRREDFIDDHPPRTSGSMSTIVGDNVRNYHWEFFRRTGDVRADLGTQVLVKNPWQRPLAMATLPRIEVGKWHRLLFVKEGSRLRGAIDGHRVFDVRDDPLGNTGPVYNFGRIGLREMYQTRMRFRNLQVWTRNPGVEVVPAPVTANSPRNP